MKINIEEVIRLKKRLYEINKYNLKNIEWFKDDKKLDIPKQIIKDFAYTGLNNTDFITSDFYEKGWESNKF